MKFSMDPPRFAQSAPGAAVNAAINGAIAWSAFSASGSVPLSMDSIGSPGVTALGNAATVAFSLTLIITFFVFRSGARKSTVAPAVLRGMPFAPTGLGIVLSNTLLAFGAFVAIAVLWQRLAGTVEVAPLGATLIVAIVAGLATAFAEWRTKREMLGRAVAWR